jgi:hypothetical protein
MADGPPGMLEKEYLLFVPARVDAVVRGFFKEHARLEYADATYLLFALD